MSLDVFMEKWIDFLNKDEELKRRLKGFKGFCGKPGPRAERAKMLGWPRDMGVACYPHPGKSMLDGRDLVELSIEANTYTIRLENGKFDLRKGKSENPCLRVKMPLPLFRDTLLSRHRWLWALADDQVKVECDNSLPHSDWITIFEVLVCAQELLEMDIEMRRSVRGW